MIDYDSGLDTMLNNSTKLVECGTHLFRQVPSSHAICERCGGEISMLSAVFYVEGYKAAGGNANDVFPGWES